MMQSTQDSIYESVLSLFLVSQQVQVSSLLLSFAFAVAAFLLIVRIIIKACARKPKSLRNQTVLITGGASGIGKLMCERLAQEGCTIIIWDIQQNLLDATVKELSKTYGRRIHGYLCDISNSEKVAECAAQVQAKFGDVDMLINNAGIVHGKSFLLTTEKDMHRTMQVNCISHFYLAKAFVQPMVKRNSGHLVTIASAAALCGVQNMTDYCASKFACFGFAESLRIELQSIAPNVRTTIVCPYYIRTGMFEGVESKSPFILPMLEPQQVADRVITAIKHEEEIVILPWAVQLIYFIRFFLPTFVLDWMGKWLGFTDAMHTFKGRC